MGTSDKTRGKPVAWGKGEQNKYCFQAQARTLSLSHVSPAVARVTHGRRVLLCPTRVLTQGREMASVF